MINFFENVDTKFWKNRNLNELNVDEAYLNVTSVFHDQLNVYSLSSECKKCPFTYISDLNKTGKIFEISTKYDTVWRFYRETATNIKTISDNASLICELNEKLDEFGFYDVIIRQEDCDFVVRKEPVNIYLPLIVTIIGLILLYCLIKVGWKCARVYISLKSKNSAKAFEGDCSIVKNKLRTRSIDAFRGFALCLMIFVNYGGGQYWFFEHCTWDGLYPADLLFPWFIWIMGVCIAFSQNSLQKKQIRKIVTLKNILKRFLLLFLMGLSLNTVGIGPVLLNELRIPGVLQRIAICFCVTSIIALFFGNFKKSSSIFKYILQILPQWSIHSAIVLLHCYLTFYLVIPGCPTGYLGAGGLQDYPLYENCTGGATGYIDRLLLGEKRLWQIAPVRRVYNTLPFDPENTLGCLTSIFQTFLGVQAGLILISQQKIKQKVHYFAIWSAVLSILGFGLHFSRLIFLNKNLWSLSFVFVTSGLAYLVFIGFYYVIDYSNIWDGSPFLYPVHFLVTRAGEDQPVIRKRPDEETSKAKKIKTISTRDFFKVIILAGIRLLQLLNILVAK